MSLLIQDLAIGYPERLVMAHMSCEIPDGTRVALLGQNGTGKSTLLRTLAGDIPALSGSFKWNGTTSRRPSIAWMPQAATLRSDAPLRVRDVAQMGLWPRLGPYGKPCKHDLEKIDQALDLVGLQDVRNVWVNQLSGGQLQRALFARVAVQDCYLLLLDEPFSAVDQETQEQLLSVIAQWATQGRMIIAAIHDAEVARHFPLWLHISKAGSTLSANGEDGRTASGDGAPPLRVITGRPTSP